MKLPLSIAALVLSAALSSCTMLTGPRATTTLLDPSGKNVGTVTFTREGTGAHLQVSVSGVTPGPHGLHVHVNPSCANSTDTSGNTVIFGGAGGHFDPGAAGHHGSPDTPNTAGHGGDLPMVNVNADGTGTANSHTEKVSLDGPNGVQGRSVVLHATTDDYKTDPAGNSGARIACGIVH